jgi:hypothetical protein
MAEKNLYAGVRNVAYINSSVLQKCEHCSEGIGLDRFSESINHYIQDHEYHLLHIGTETSQDADGRPWQGTGHGKARWQS